LLQVRDIITGEADLHRDPVTWQHVHDTDWHGGVELAKGVHHHPVFDEPLTLVAENQDAPKISLVNGQELEVACLSSKGEMIPGQHLVQVLDRSRSAAYELWQEGHGPDDGPDHGPVMDRMTDRTMDQDRTLDPSRSAADELLQEVSTEEFRRSQALAQDHMLLPKKDE
jgi:hypothetical protein